MARQKCCKDLEKVCNNCKEYMRNYMKEYNAKLKFIDDIIDQDTCGKGESWLEPVLDGNFSSGKSRFGD